MQKFLPTSLRQAQCKLLSVNKKGLALSDPEFIEGESKGFTLVELLIVVAIIAVLAVIGIIVFGNVQKGARDARRKADINAIASALEFRVNTIPNPCNQAVGTYCAPQPNWFASGVIPADPLPNLSYTGLPIGGAPTYNICATLELGGSYCRANQQ